MGTDAIKIFKIIDSWVFITIYLYVPKNKALNHPGVIESSDSKIYLNFEGEFFEIFNLRLLLLKDNYL